MNHFDKAKRSDGYFKYCKTNTETSRGVALSHIISDLISINRKTRLSTGSVIMERLGYSGLALTVNGVSYIATRRILPIYSMNIIGL